MPAKSTKIGEFPSPQSSSSLSATNAYRSSAAVKVIEKKIDSVEKPAGENSYSIESKSDTRMLQARGICQSRLETLALMDFQPLFEGNRRTLAGNLANVRQTLREIDRKSSVKIIEDLKSLNEDAYQSALDNYSANLSSAQVEYELLKNAYLMRQYASLAFSYNSHISNLILPTAPTINLGRTAYEFYNISLNFAQDPKLQQSNATVNFLQLLADITAFSRLGFPAVLNSGVRKLQADSIIFDLGVSSPVGSTLPQQCIRVARELASSLKIQEVRSGEGEQKELHPKFKSTVGSEFFTSNAVPSYSVFEKLLGFDPWYQDSSSFSFNPTPRSSKTIGTMAALGGLAGAVDYEPTGLMLLEEQIRTYGSKTYLPPSSLVNTAFKPSSPLNFSTYKNVSEAFYGKCLDASNLLKNLYYPNFSYSGNYQYNIAGNNRLNSLSVFEAVATSFRKRFLSNELATSIYGNAKNFSSRKSRVSYIQNIAHIFVRDRPESAAKILMAFFDDLNQGNLNTDETKAQKVNYEKDSNLLKAKSLVTEWYNTREKISPYVPSRQGFYPSAQQDPEVYCPEPGDWRSQVALTKNPGDNVTTNVYENQLLFEVIAYGMKILNEILIRFSSIQPITDTGEAVWPNSGISLQQQSTGKTAAVVPNEPQQSQVPDPYWDPDVLSMLSTDQSMGASTWIPIARAFTSKFLRPSTGKTFAGGVAALEIFKGIFSLHSSIMGKDFSMLKVKTARASIRFGQSGYRTASGQWVSNPGYTQDVNIMMIASSENLSSTLTGKNSGFIAGLDEALRGRDVTKFVKDSKGQKFGTRLAGAINQLKDDEAKLSASINILQKFGERVQSFSSLAIDTFTGSIEDSNPVYALLNALVAQGNSGLDILENLTPEQISLKKVTSRRQSGIPAYQYLPAVSFISTREKLSVECLASSRMIKAPEGLNLRCLSVGIPAGMLANLGLPNKFSVMLKMSDLEFSDIVFAPKQYNFDSTVFINTDSFESANRFSNFDDLVRQIRFLKSSLSVQEVPGSTPRLTLSETSRVVNATSTDFDVYSNTAASALLEIYYRLLLGLELSEDTFESETGNMNLPINQYANNLAGAMAAFAADVQLPGTRLSNSLKKPANIASGAALKEAEKTSEFTELDAEFLASVRNSFTTRLLSAQDMRDTILKAKVFDRVLHILVDPDEFVVSTVRNPTDGIFTPDTVLDKMIKNKTLVSFVERGVQYYKLAPRKVAEGRMAFVKIIASVEPGTSKGTAMVKS